VQGGESGSPHMKTGCGWFIRGQRGARELAQELVNSEQRILGACGAIVGTGPRRRIAYRNGSDKLEGQAHDGLTEDRTSLAPTPKCLAHGSG